MTAMYIVTLMIMLINLLLAYAHAQKGEICYTVINCTLILMCMMSITRQRRIDIYENIKHNIKIIMLFWYKCRAERIWVRMSYLAMVGNNATYVIVHRTVGCLLIFEWRIKDG